MYDPVTSDNGNSESRLRLNASPSTFHRHVLAIINSDAGPGTPGTERIVQAALQEARVDATTRIVSARELEKVIRDATRGGADAVVACGGDGTVNAVATAIAGTSTPMGVLPTGTLNHFARDVGIPTDIRLAARVVAEGVVRSVDVAEVNGRVFVNNASIGLYPAMVRERERQIERLGRGKIQAMLLAAATVFARYPLLHVQLRIDDRPVTRTTPFVFVGNNPYAFHLFALGARARLDTGELGLYVPHRTGRWGLLRLAMRALFGRLEQAADFDAVNLEEAVVETRKRRVNVATDGEVTAMTPPLRFRVRPGALRVIVPPDLNT